MALDVFKLSGTVDVSTGKAEASLKRLDAGARNAQGGLNRIDGSSRRAGSGLGSVAGHADRAASSVGRLGSALSSAASKLSGMGRSGGGFGDMFKIAGGNLLSGAIQKAVGGVTNALQEGWRAGIEYNKMLETTTVRFSRFFDSAQSTDAFVKSVEKFAAISPIFDMESAANGAQRLLDMKFAAEKVVPMLTAIGDAVGGVGGDAENIKRVTHALGQMVGTGRIQSDEMNQLTENLIPAWELLAKAIGKTEAETRQLVEAGRIKGGAVEGIVAMMGEKFAGQSEKAAKTFAGQQAQLESAMEMQFAQATKGNFGQLKTAMEAATTGLGTKGAQAFGAELNKMLTEIGNSIIPEVGKLATGEAFTSAARTTATATKALTTGESIAKSFNEGDYKAFSEKTDALIKQGVGAGLEKAKSFVMDVAKKLGLTIGDSTIEGTKESLQMKSPSKVMMEMGELAAQSFGTGFQQGVEKNIDRTSEGMKRWAEAIKKAGGDEFVKAVEELSRRLGIDPNKLMNVMAFESRLNPAAKNPNSSGTGLIQFMGPTAAGLGTSTDALKKMTAVQQLPFVEAYLKQRGQIPDTQEALYTSVLAGRPVADPNALLFKQGGKRTGRAFAANSALDADKSGIITAGEATAKVLEQGFLTASKAAATAAVLPTVGAVTAKIAPLTAGIAKIAPPAGTLTKALEGVPAPATAATKAMTTAGSRVGEWANQIDEATKKVKESTDYFKEAFANGFDDLFDQALNGEKLDFKSFGKSLFKGFTANLISGMTGGKASSPGGLLSQMLFGGGGQGGGGGFLTGGFAGGPSPAAGIVGGGSGSGGGIGGALNSVSGMLGKGGILSKIPGIGKVGGFLTKLPGIGGFLGKIGGLFGMGGGAAAGAGGAAAGAGGMAAMFSNPVTAIIGGALMAVPLLGKLFGKDPLSDYRKLIKGEYGIDVKSKSILGNIMQIGQSKFGNEWMKRKIETVRLPEVRDMLSEYSGAFSRGGNSKLFDSRILSDAFSSENRFKVPMMANGGWLNAGQMAIVGERRPELFIPHSSGRVVPSIGGMSNPIEGGMWGKMMMEVLEDLRETMAGIRSIPEDHVVINTLHKNPDIATRAVERSFSQRSESSKRIRDHVGTR